MRVRVLLEPVFHPKDVESWIRVYVPGTNVNVTFKGFEVELPDNLTASTTLCVWWYVTRIYHSDKHVASCPKETKTKLALCETTLQRAGTGETLLADGSKFDLFDIEHQRVATAVISSSAVARPTTKPLEAKGASSGDKWLGLVREFHRQQPQLRQTNITEMGSFVFGKVVTPYGTMPGWGFAYLASKRAEKVAYNDTLLSLFYNACYFTFLKPEDFDKAPLNHKLELLGEMQTMAMRFLVYVRDTSLRLGQDHLVDDWTRIADSPVPALIEYDCEDGAEEMIAQATALRQAQGLTGALAELQRLECCYFSCFCIVTLRLGGTSDWVYHAVVMKFDCRWLLRKLGLDRRDLEFKNPLPPLLLESTAYTTSNWKFETPFCTEKMFSTADEFIEANTKICAEMVAEPCLYGHLVTFYCPELLETYSVGQVECAFNGKRGIPIKTLMTESDHKGIEFLACKTDTDRIRQMTNESQLWPDTPMLKVAKPVQLRRREYVRPPKAQFLVRDADAMDISVVDRITAAAHKMGSRVTLDKVQVYGGIGGINVVVE